MCRQRSRFLNSISDIFHRIDLYKGFDAVKRTAIIFPAAMASAVAKECKRFLVLTLLSGAIEFFSV